MARADIAGFFWNDIPPPKAPKKEAIKRTPPERIWESDDYLPGLEESRRFPVQVMSWQELNEALSRGEELILDVEINPNYFLIMFLSFQTGKVFFLEEIEGVSTYNKNTLKWILSNFKTIGFNSLNFDLTICYLAIAGLSTRELWEATEMLIAQRERPYKVLRHFKTKQIKCDHIDLIEVAPLFEGLKGYGARMHVPKLQDLPFPPGKILNEDQITCTRWYCVNDTHITAYLYNHIHEHIDIRIAFGEKYNKDFRSLSDAQMAEEVIREELKKVTGVYPKKPQFSASVGLEFYYKPPAYIQFQTAELQQALYEMSSTPIVVGESGHAQCPKEIRKRVVVIGGRPYKVGMGGLHSQEKRQAIVSRPGLRLIDRDVTGYYPNLMLKNGFSPPQFGNALLVALQGMVDRRTFAKREMQRIEKAGGPFDDYYLTMKSESDGLKISNNGLFGKLSDPFSIVYDVPNMVQVTLTGQLSLLMIIEALELRQFPVVSANTDGIVATCPSERYDEMNALFAAWEAHTGLETEETEYRALYSANVNNYIAVKMNGKTKPKGWYSERGSAHNSILSKNPETLICSDAVQQFLVKGTPLSKTIYECKDIRRFVAVRSVDGGAVKVWEDDHIEYLGKKIRWYYSKDVEGEIIYAKTGNKVARSDNARPLMELCQGIPEDLDYEWYVERAEKMLKEIGYYS